MRDDRQLDLFEELFSQRHSDTSRAAAKRATAKAPTDRYRVFDLLAHEPKGLTDEQIQTRLRLNANTERPRRVELERRNLVRDSGRRRKTRSGCLAVVWIVTGNARYPEPKR
jgi:hypothetical protein